MRFSASVVVALTLLVLAAGSSEDSSTDPVPTPEAPAAAAAVADPLEAELDALLPLVQAGFVVSPESSTQPVALPASVRTGPMEMPAETEDAVPLQGYARAQTPGGPVYYVASVMPAGAGIYSFYQLRRGPSGKLVKTPIGTQSREACGDHEVFKGTLEADGGMMVEIARWTEVCPDGGEPTKTESLIRVHPDGRVEPIAG